MAIPERYLQKDSWPHQFTRAGEITPLGGGRVAELYYCYFCHLTYKQGIQARPIGVCPARNDRTEKRRLGV